MKILLGTLKDKGEALASFLEPRIGTKPELGGGELTIEDSSLKEGLRSRHVKTYIKRFLWKEKVRRDYRVLVERGEFRIVEIEGTEEEEEEKKEQKEEKASEAKEEPKKEEKVEEKEEKKEEEEEAKPEPKPEKKARAPRKSKAKK